MTRRRRSTLYAWAAITAALTATDWPSELLARFWGEHSLVSGVVSGLVLLGVAVFVIESWIEAREAHYWQRVARIAFKALGRSAEEVREGMDQLVTGRFPHVNTPLFVRTFSDQLTTTLNSNRVWRSIDANDPDRIDHAARLDVLLHDAEWLELADEAIKVIRFHHRDRIAQWASAMLASRDLARTIDRVAALNDRVNAFHRPIFLLLAEQRVPRTGQVAVDEFRDSSAQELRDTALLRWHEVLLEATSIQEDLNRAAGDSGFTNVWGRSRLRPAQRAALSQRRAADPWKPAVPDPAASPISSAIG